MAKRRETIGLEEDPLWYKDAVIYELHVRAFHDSDGNGIGDFRGLTEKLDYLQDLGVTALWLLPFYPSPLRDDGYDIADYTSVHPTYGTLADFRRFLNEAHRRGLRVITELVLNHTSDQHPWFQRARHAKPGSRWRDFYVWSDTADKYRGTRIIFKDFEPSNWTWDPVAKAYFWHRFYSHQPDLNFENPEVVRALYEVLDFWLEMGVDGMRLDAVPYLHEREGTSCENLPETHAVLRELRAHVDKKFRNRMLLAEANQWPEDASAYFGQGDECHMNFHFPLMPRLFMSMYMEDRHPILDILNLTPPIPEPCQWALFLRNHDELTLEMVTDEERSYMYRVYAQDPQMRINLGIRRRLAPLLGNHRRRIELLNGLLLSMPGTPVLYYGDEIGMGDNIYLGDRNGVRTPMQWSADRNAGFSRSNPHRLYLPINIDPEYHYEAVNVDMQQNNPHSLLWWTKRLIALRKRFKAFGRGSMEFLHPENHKILAFVRRWKDEVVLVIANLSRFVQCAELDLSAFAGMVPVEAFSRTEFTSVTEKPYFFTMGPQAFMWFSLVPPRTVETTFPEEGLPAIEVGASWEGVIKGRARTALLALLPAWLRARRWFAGKARKIRAVDIRESIPLQTRSGGAQILIVQVEYAHGDAERYLLPLACRPAGKREAAAAIRTGIARLTGGKESREERILFDAVEDPEFSRALLSALREGRDAKGAAGRLASVPGRLLRADRKSRTPIPEPVPQRLEQSNSAVLFGDRYLLKLYRKLEEGENPDVEIGLYLTEKRAFPHSPPVAGHLRWVPAAGAPITLGVVHGYVTNQGDAWRYTLDAQGRFLEQVLARTGEPPRGAAAATSLLGLSALETPAWMSETAGEYVGAARLLGRRTAEMHLALAAAPDLPDFAPEPFTDFYQRSIYHAMLSLAGRNLGLLRQHQKSLPTELHAAAAEVLRREAEIRKAFLPVRDRALAASRIRCHGDYHLGQVLHTGDDFKIIDYEGEPARGLAERRIKRCPLRDVAGMVRSFHYASQAAFHGMVPGVRPEDAAPLRPWLREWYRWVTGAFLSSYLEAVGAAPLLPKNPEERGILLEAFVLEKALYELGYELNNRPAWVGIPLRGILDLIDHAG